MCNAIVGNFSCVKKPATGPRTDAIISVRAAATAVAAHVTSPRHTQRHSLSDSFEMHCRKARSTRGQCESNIGKQFFSGKNFSAAFQDFGPYWLVLWHPRTTAPPPSSLPSPNLLFSILFAASIPRSCSASVVPAHFLRTTFKPRSFLAIKECPR